MAYDLPDTINDVEQLEELLSRPTQSIVDVLRDVDGDVIVLGAAGKMGPTLTRMLIRASQLAGQSRRVYAASRFSNEEIRKKLKQYGVETLEGDLMDPAFLAELPDARNVIFMAGMKFGSTGKEAKTWALNTYLPSLICRRYSQSRLVAFSTGNVYGLTDSRGSGSLESDAPSPVGEYAMSCLGRERMIEYFCESTGLKTSIIRLNYANELRYGVLVDIARHVYAGEPVDLNMGYVNVIWQGDANAMAIASLTEVSSPPFVVNVAGPEKLRVRDICHHFGRAFGRKPVFVGTEAETALLSCAKKAFTHFGEPRIGLEQMYGWIAHWIERNGEWLGKPTHFDVRDGRF